MKIALYIEEGLEQIVLTPEGDVEKAILKKLDDADRIFSIKHGSFYQCKGGWLRQGGMYDESTMIVLHRASDLPVPSRSEQGPGK